jgi:cation:H+ antiporter
MKKRTFIGCLIILFCVFHSLLSNAVFAKNNSLAEQVFEKHKTTLQQNDVQNVLPDVLKVFKDPEIQAGLTTNNLSQVVVNPESLKELAPKVDAKFTTLLKEDSGLQALFNDTDFHSLLQDVEAIAELARLIKAGWLEFKIRNFHILLLLLIIVVTLYALSKGADWLVDEAVVLSTRWGLGKAVIGATIVSIGTTTPEAAVSVFSALQGKPGLALGNAVGSIICDTGLILGLASLIAPLSFNRQLASRLSNVQVSAGILMVLACLPWTSPMKAFSQGGMLPQFMGFVFVVLLGLYIWQSIRWAGTTKPDPEQGDHTDAESSSSVVPLLKLIGSIAIVVISAQILIPAVSVLAIRFKVPESIISLTLVAFGTSLPELVTAITAVRRGHGELAVGNIIGADILNVLFVAGVSAAATKGGLIAEAHFFQFAFPAMLFILIVFRFGIFVSGSQLKRPFGVVLVAVWLIVIILSAALGVGVH